MYFYYLKSVIFMCCNIIVLFIIDLPFYFSNIIFTICVVIKHDNEIL